MAAGGIFLSHNWEDKEFVRHLADDLRRAGVTVWVDEAEIRIGDSIIEKIEEGLKGSEYLGAVLSPSSVASRWVREELRSVLHQQIGGKEYTVLPILYKKCELPFLITDRRYADFTNPDQYEFAVRQLLSRLDPSFSPPLFVSSADLDLLLSKIPVPKMRSLWGPHDDVRYVSDNSLDLSELNAAVAWPKPKVLSALRELIAKHKVELFILHGMIENDDHPTIRRGTVALVPIVFRGLLPPGLRPSPDDIEKVLRD